MTYMQTYSKGKTTPQSELRMSKIATLGLVIFAMVLGILFEKQNVAFMVGLGILSCMLCKLPSTELYLCSGKVLTTRGAVIGGVWDFGNCG